MFSPLRFYTSVLYLFRCAVKKFEVKDRHMSFYVWKFPLNKLYTTYSRCDLMPSQTYYCRFKSSALGVICYTHSHITAETTLLL